jgi:hypothetical protein
MGDGEKVHPGAPIKGLCELWVCPPNLRRKRYGSLHDLSIHFCFQRLHLWVTASAHNLVYRELIRKYFGTEILQVAEVDNGCRFLDWGSGVLSIDLGRASV